MECPKTTLSYPQIFGRRWRRGVRSAVPISGPHLVNKRAVRPIVTSATQNLPRLALHKVSVDDHARRTLNRLEIQGVIR